jgi:hypothetical protein
MVVSSSSVGDERMKELPLRTEEEGTKAQAAPTTDERIASFMIEKVLYRQIDIMRSLLVCVCEF